MVDDKKVRKSLEEFKPHWYATDKIIDIIKTFANMETMSSELVAEITREIDKVIDEFYDEFSE